MSLLDYLERRFRGFALPNLTLGLVVCQVMVFLAMQVLPRPEDQVDFFNRLLLVPNLVLEGEVWRLGTFLLLPPFTNIVWALFFWYLFWLMGTALEHYWGAFRYNVYLLIGYLATVAASFLQPDSPSANVFLEGSVFLAFAFLNPDFELYIFFLVPVKIKWLALLTWIGYFLAIIFGTWLTRALVLASVCNFLLFFAKDILFRIQGARRRMALQAAHFSAGNKKPEYFHRCTVCGITDRTNPKMEFRYCSKCAGNCGYCSEHLHNHEHVVAEKTAL